MSSVLIARAQVVTADPPPPIAVPADVVNLDFMRALAVLCVYCAHLASAMGIHNTGSLGRFAVIVFFVHTSFVLLASLERMESSRFAGPFRLTAAFAIRRFFRIYPLAIFYVALMCVFRIPASPGLTYHWVGMKAFLSNLALTQNLTFSELVLDPLWSLPLEVQMCVFLPVAYYVVKGGRFRSFAFWIAAVALALTLPRVSGRLTFFLYGPCFASGVVAFDLWPTARRRLPGWMWPAAICLAVALFGPFDDVSMGPKLTRAWLLSLFLGVMVTQIRAISWIWVHRVSHLVAKYSYGIYLGHSATFWLAIYKMAQQPLWERITVLVLGSVIPPVALYHCIEHPLIGWGTRLAGPLRSQPKGKAALPA